MDWKFVCTYIDERIWLAFPIFLLKINSLYTVSRNHTLSSVVAFCSNPIYTFHTSSDLYVFIVVCVSTYIIERDARVFFNTSRVSGKLFIKYNTRICLTYLFPSGGSILILFLWLEKLLLACTFSIKMDWDDLCSCYLSQWGSLSARKFLKRPKIEF